MAIKGSKLNVFFTTVHKYFQIQYIFIVFAFKYEVF